VSEVGGKRRSGKQDRLRAVNNEGPSKGEGAQWHMINVSGEKRSHNSNLNLREMGRKMERTPATDVLMKPQGDVSTVTPQGDHGKCDG